MAQTGCPQGTGTGGSKYPNLPAEFNAEKHVRGVCSMARSQAPNSANSQFFICFDDATFLDKQYTVWGKVTEGMDNVDKIKTRRAGGQPRQDQVAQGGRRCVGVRPSGRGGVRPHSAVLQVAISSLRGLTPFAIPRAGNCDTVSLGSGPICELSRCPVHFAPISPAHSTMS